MLNKIMVLSGCLILSLPSYAVQVRPAKDNQTISAKISAKELSRIFVTGDRIQATRGINGAYEIIKDDKQGMIFIKPSPYYASRPFNLFITTEIGRTYNLLLVPTDIPAETIEIKPKSPAIKIASKWEKNSPYVDKLIQLINAMVNELEPEGYAVSEVTTNPIRVKDISMQLVSVYRGSHLQGEVWCIKNISRHTIYLSPNQFFDKHVRAVALEREMLSCGDEVYLYKVGDHG